MWRTNWKNVIVWNKYFKEWPDRPLSFPGLSNQFYIWCLCIEFFINISSQPVNKSIMSFWSNFFILIIIVTCQHFFYLDYFTSILMRSLVSLISVIYLGDFLLIGKPKDECVKNAKITCPMVEKWGFVVEGSGFFPANAN